MSRNGIPERPSDRQPFAGAAERKPPILVQREGGPFNAVVRVVPIVGLRSGWGEKVFAVEAEWDGPPLPGSGFPPTDKPVHCQEQYLVDDADLAQRAARELGDELRRGNVPDVREVLRRLTG